MKHLPAIAVFLGLAILVAFLPGVKPLGVPTGRGEVATVTAVDDSELTVHGLIEYGTQRLTVRLKGGSEHPAVNEMRAQMDLDKRFAVGDSVLVILGEDPLVARDHWRLGWAAGLFLGFCVLLVVFGGWVGLKALLSFVFSCLVVWKILVPLCLRGWDAAGVSFAVVAGLTGSIMYLTAGWTKKALAATLGALLGVSASLALAAVSTRLMNVNGATMPFAQPLVYSGFECLSLSSLFVGSVLLASSGAVMDLAMDIAAGVGEVARHRPDLPRRELCRSGVRIGRSVVGTMTTTLLLAYSGGYLTLLMMFAAQGTRVVDFLNSTLVSAELVKTLVGSFGLVLVAPFTALVSAWLFGKGKHAPTLH